MFTKLKAALGRHTAAAEAARVPAVEYKGYRILPAPDLNSNSAYQTAETIEEPHAGERKKARVRPGGHLRQPR